MSEISLSTGMRNNLLQLQNTSKLIEQTQQRLSTGKKVNSALDSATNYFAAQSHINRANDFEVRKDGMAEAIQNVKAADAGIKAISALIESAKGLAESAMGTSITADRSSLASQFNALRSQIDSLASDSSYRGTNLLTSQNLTVNFNEDASAKLTVSGFDATSSGLAVGSAANNWVSNADIQAASANLGTATNTLRSQSKTLANNMNVITTRSEFTDNIINTLKTGSDNLTLADMSLESANMLALQTKQSLGTSALSLSSQAAASVLRLF